MCLRPRHGKHVSAPQSNVRWHGSAPPEGGASGVTDRCLDGACGVIGAESSEDPPVQGIPVGVGRQHGIAHPRCLGSCRRLSVTRIGELSIEPVDNRMRLIEAEVDKELLVIMSQV